MKGFKGFGRRKSSGNILESEKAPQQPSFRVLERPSVDTSVKNFGASADSPKRRTPILRPKSSPLQFTTTKRSPTQDERASSAREVENLSSRDSKTWTRGSDRTFGSVSTADHRALRDSYASTDPSSVESVHQLPPTTQPVKMAQEPRKFSFKTMSFTSRNDHPQDEDNEPVPDLPNNGIRQRAMTESSYTSTVVPPKLDLGDNGDFSSSFSSDMFSKRKSTIMEETAAGSAEGYPGKPTYRSRPEDASAARDRSTRTASFSNADNDAEARMTFSNGLDSIYGDTAAAILAVNGGSGAGHFLNDYSTPPTFPSRSSNHESTNTFSQPREPSPYSRVVPKAPASHLFPGQNSDRLTVQKPHIDLAASDDDVPLIFDTSKSAVNSRQVGRPVNHVKQPSKVMTPSEFAEYKSKKENGLLEHQDGQQPDSESDDDYDRDDDEYETERNRKAIKQRAIQDAHLSVYRQQMMKTTGEQPSDLPSNLARSGRPVLDRLSKSAPILSAATVEIKTTKPPSDDEDDDVPLGVLQAHGFPGKNRPPSRLAGPAVGGTSRPSTQMSSYPAPAGATRNESAAGGGGRLPPFARNLPSDPYIGASHVNQPSRQSMSFGGGAQQPAPMPPGGLVGVIAGEERARAMRRGSPNARGTYDPVPAPSAAGFAQPQMPAPMLTPMEAQMQTVNSMAQMNQAMQMQMQWMQQMMQMQGLQMPANQFQMPMQTMGVPQQGMLQPNGNVGQLRPGSSASQLPHQRAMSMMSTGGFGANMGNNRNALNVPSSSQSVYGMQDLNLGYAPSIAPSERSNVGQPSRYRPVSTVGVEPSRPQSRSTVAGLGGQGAKRFTVRAVEKPKKPAHDSDDEDREGWEEMKRKKQAKKGLFRRNKANGAPGMDSEPEGLYYEG